MYGEIGNHAFADKTLLNKFSRKLDIFLHRQFVLQGDIEAVCELRFLVLFRVFDRIPQGFSVLILRRSVRWQEDFGMNDAAFSCVVAVLAVVIAVKTFSCAVGGACNRALTRAALDLFYAEMIERENQPPSFLPL